MKKYLTAALFVFLFSIISLAQNTGSPQTAVTPTPTPDEEQKEFMKKLDKDAEKYENFTVSIKSAEIICEGVNECLLKVIFDQSFIEIQRISHNLKFDPKAPYKNVSKDDKNEFFNIFQDVAKFRFINLKDNSELSLTIKTISNVNVEPNPNSVVFTINSAIDLKSEDGYTLVFYGKKLEKGTPKPNPVMIPVTVSASCERLGDKMNAAVKVPAQEITDIKKFANDNFTTAADASNPELKINFGMSGRTETQPYYQTEISAEPFELKRLGMHGAYSWVPFYFQLQRNDTPKSEVDKLYFGTKFKHLFVFNDDGEYTSYANPTPRMIGIQSEVSIGWETTSAKFVKHPFTNGKVILGLKTGLPINLKQSRSQVLRVTPFFGIDFGRLFPDEESISKEKWIIRPNVGGEFYWTPYRKETKTPVTVEARYITRAFLRRELIYKRDDKFDTVLEGPSSNPKHYFTASVTLFGNQLFSPFVKYTYGRDTPEYLPERNLYTVGIQANFDWGKK